MRDDELKMEFDNDQVAGLLHTLKRVEAPADFDVRVRARIAAGRPERSGFGIPVFVRYAVPIVLLVVVGGYFGYRAMRVAVPVSEPVVAVIPKTDAAPAAQPPTAAQPAVPMNATSATLANKERDNSVTAIQAKKPVRRNERTGWSSDEAVRESRRLSPQGEVPVLDMLTNIGVRGAVESGGLKVAAATGIADRSGIKAGDVIESVDGKSVMQKNSVKGTAAGKIVRVTRDGKSVDVVLKN
jgi:membrane-associated protease RseP (regulator of RpoE activity)